MKMIYFLFFGFIFAISLVSISLIIISIVALGLWFGAHSSYFGSLLEMMGDYRILSTIIFFSGLMLVKNVRDDGRKPWLKLFKIAEHKIVSVMHIF